MDYEQIVTDVSRTLVQQIAPQELPLFGATRAAHLKNPRRALRGQTSKDEILGFGGADDVAFLTPIILTAASRVAELAAGSSQANTGRGLAGLLRGLRKTPAANTQSPADQAARAREVAVATLRENHFPADQVDLVADTLVRELVAREVGGA